MNETLTQILTETLTKNFGKGSAYLLTSTLPSVIHLLIDLPPESLMIVVILLSIFLLFAFYAFYKFMMDLGPFLFKLIVLMTFIIFVYQLIRTEETQKLSETLIQILDIMKTFLTELSKILYEISSQFLNKNS